MIIAERGAPLKAQVRPVAPKIKQLDFTSCFIFLFSVVWTGLWNEPPVKQGIDNTLQQRDEQTHILRVYGDRAQSQAHVAREKLLYRKSQRKLLTKL